MKFPPECIDALKKFDLPALEMWLKTLRRQLDDFVSQLFIIRALRSTPSPEITSFLRKVFPDLAHIFDASPDERKTQEEAILYLRDVQEVRLSYFRVMIEHLEERSGKAPPPESQVVGQPDASVE